MYFTCFQEGETRIGAEDENCNQDIVLRGPGLESNHCTILLENGVATLVPADGAICIVNGLQVDRSTRLSQGKWLHHIIAIEE